MSPLQTTARHGNCTKNGTPLVHGFMPLVCRYRIGNNTGTGLNMQRAILDHSSTYRDRRIHIPRP